MFNNKELVDTLRQVSSLIKEAAEEVDESMVSKEASDIDLGSAMQIYSQYHLSSYLNAFRDGVNA
jgi:hypothetical protein